MPFKKLHVFLFSCMCSVLVYVPFHFFFYAKLLPSAVHTLLIKGEVMSCFGCSSACGFSVLMLPLFIMVQMVKSRSLLEPSVQVYGLFDIVQVVMFSLRKSHRLVLELVFCLVLCASFDVVLVLYSSSSIAFLFGSLLTLSICLPLTFVRLSIGIVILVTQPSRGQDSHK